MLQKTTNDKDSDVEQMHLDRIADLLSVYWTYHMPPRNYPKILNNEHALHIVINRHDSDNEETNFGGCEVALEVRGRCECTRP